MRKLSRVVVINDASSAFGGATGIALLSIRLYRARGIDVTFIVGDSGDNAEPTALGAEVVSVGGRQLMNETPLVAAMRGIYNPAANRTLRSWMASSDTANTVYHVHGWSKILSPSIFDALRPVASRTVVHAHDFFLACPNGGFMDYVAGRPCSRAPLSFDCLKTNCDKRSYAQKMWRVARQLALQKSFDFHSQGAKILMIHEKMADLLIRSGYPRDRLVTVRNPATGFTAKRIPAERNRAIYFVGRLEAEKGIEDAITAAKRAKVPFKVIGDGPLRPRLSSAFPDVQFLGWNSRERIADLLADARALVMPSRYPEPYGLVVAEASQSGLPIVLSASAFLAQEVVDKGIGFSCNTQDADALSALFARLDGMSSDEIRVMSERAFSNVAHLSNTPDRWADELLAIYEERISAAAAWKASTIPAGLAWHPGLKL
ncbi:glycosyltransferase family 4 protein [Sinorhizobium fredii]|uniref:glycosyltransferase family 4 protein n=1 Tax=Rhizobium fredii TaxID=380 RepID=UPI0013044942|nr:glycosyltransferase family 4 protein [Sinorhizobium fredii]